MTPASDRRRVGRQLAAFLAAFFVVWSLRATVFFAVDESIDSPILRASYSNLLKLCLWVLPAAAYACWLRDASPAGYLGVSVAPDVRCWGICLGVTAAFLLGVALFELIVDNRSVSTAGLAALPAVPGILQFGVSPLLEEILFRGLVMKELLRLLPVPLAGVLCSALFVGVHLPHWLWRGGAMMGNAPGVFVFSLLACWLYAKSGSIWPPTVAHIANNLLVSLLVAGRAGAVH
jgi:membrane protease YdiL (CAAX protease family)